MGFVDWLKGTFGKQSCAFCGAEVGMLKRTKIKNKEFICNDCGHGCSRYIQKYRYTKDELLGHMEYMKRQDRLYNEVLAGRHTRIIPSVPSVQSIEFYDEHGMFRIWEISVDRQDWKKELFRYDQVAKYEPYIEESEPSEPGKEKEFSECGVRITLVGAEEDTVQLRKGLRPHPYITEELEICVNKRDKRTGMMEVNQIIAHFDYIFGVRDNVKPLLGFGPTKQQRREGAALKAMGDVFSAAINTAKNGGEINEQTAAQVADAMNKVDDAATGGLAEYTRLADAAEAKV